MTPAQAIWALLQLLPHGTKFLVWPFNGRSKCMEASNCSLESKKHWFTEQKCLNAETSASGGSPLYSKSRKSKRWACGMCTLLISSRRQKCEVCGSTRPDQNSISSCTNQIDGRIAKQSSKSSLGDTESVMKQDKCPKINAWVKGRKKESALPQRVELPLHKTYLREQNQRTNVGTTKRKRAAASRLMC